MRVLFLIDTLEVGGTEQSILEISRHFTSTKATISHVYPGDTLRVSYEEAGIPVVPLGIRADYGFVQAVRALRKLIREYQPDVLHVGLFRAGVIGRVAGSLERRPVVDTFVSDSYGQGRLDGLTLQRRLKLSAVQAADGLTARLVTHFVANSDAVAQSNARALGINRARISVIHRGRDPRPFDPSYVVRSKPHSSEGHPLTGPILLNVGRLLESKGQADLLHAFARLRERRTSAHLLIAGEGPFRPKLEKLRRDLSLEESVHFLGHRSDIAGLLAAADIFVFPSHVEGHSGALIEAMFSETPIVASDIPENRESVEHRRTALLAPSREPEVLAETILAMIDHPDEALRMARNARREAMHRFDIRLIARKHEELYREVIAEYKHLKRHTA